MGGGLCETDHMSELDEAKKVMSYLIGRTFSQALPQIAPGVEADDLDAAMVGKGLDDALHGHLDESIVNQKVDAYQQLFIQMIQERANAKGKKNLEIGKTYMAENAKRTGVTTTASGLQYEVITPGTGETYDPAKHGEAPTAEVMYKGTLVDGTVFDQSKQPVKFNIKQVIPGFTEALKLMPVGATWKVTIPAELAYGAHGPGSIGPNSTLIFEMSLISLTK